MFEHLWRSAGFEKAPIDFSGTSYTAMRRMAGNSFNQCCASTFVAYVLARLKPQMREQA